jgi:AcrR family transcriptional regulator
MPDPADPPRLRADAVHNRVLLLQAAEEVFSEQGVYAPLEAVSRRAGVGRATLFRNFPDRRSLLIALLERGLDNIAAEAARLQAAPDALVQLLHHVLERVMARAPLVECWQTIGRGQPEIAAALLRLMAIFEPLVRRAVAEGRCRADLVPADILLLLSLFDACTAPVGPRMALSDRIWRFALDIVQPAPPKRPRRRQGAAAALGQ